MTLAELYAKLPEVQHDRIRVVDGQVVYDAGGAAIYRAVIDGAGQLVPLDMATRNALAALGA